MVDCLQNAYKARLFKMFVLNANFIIKILWGIVEGFMDPITKSKICLTSGSDPKELKDIIAPCQLLKEYGGEADPPEKYWPPIFPPGYRNEFKTKHHTQEEFKNELLNNAQMVPSPDLASFVREARHGKSKKGIIPKKNYNINGKIQRRDSFNGIIPEIKEVVNESKKQNIPVVVQNPLPKPEDKKLQEQIEIKDSSHIETVNKKEPEIKVEEKLKVEEQQEEVNKNIEANIKIEEPIQERASKMEEKKENNIQATNDIKIELKTNEPPPSNVEVAREKSKEEKEKEAMVNDSKKFNSMELKGVNPGCQCKLL